MTIDEAIAFEKAYADDERQLYDDGGSAEYQEQIIEYLEELKAIKENAVFYSNRPIEDIVLEARADAFDEFVKKAFEKQHALFNNPSVREQMQFKTFLYVIAEQLKDSK